jgi:hypothetical protein
MSEKKVKIDIYDISEKPIIKNVEIDIESPNANVGMLKEMIKSEDEKRNEIDHDYLLFYKNCKKNETTGYNECDDDSTLLKDIIQDHSKKQTFHFAWKLGKNLNRYSGGKKTKKQRKTKKHRKTRKHKKTRRHM